MKFIGIDIAWKIESNPKHPRCAITVLDHECKITGNCILKTDDEIVSYARENVDPDGVIIGIDAPLVIPEGVEKQRPCERIMGKIDIPAYPSNRKRFNEVFNGVRGENLVSLLESNIAGLRYVDTLDPCRPTKSVLEIYPYATLKFLFWEARHGEQLTLQDFRKVFNQIKVPKYKGKGLSKNERIKGLQQNIELIRTLAGLNCSDNYSPTLSKENFNVLNPVLTSSMINDELEQIADYLDSAVAAYTVWHYWRYGDTRSVVVGNKLDGYILMPADEYIKARLNVVIS